MAAPKYAPYVLARNHHKRPLCQHIRTRSRANKTLCGREMKGWLIQYSNQKITVLFCVLCERAAASGQH